MITCEYVVLGTYIVQAETEEACLDQANDDMSEVFIDYTIKEVK